MGQFNKQYIDFLGEELFAGKLVVFVGAGASIDSELPSWNNLIKNFAKKLGKSQKWFTMEETLMIPEIYYDKFGKVPYYRILKEIFSKNYTPNAIHKELEDFKTNYVITTNYDDLIEQKVNSKCDYDVIKKDEDLAHSIRNKMIIKMHGDLDNQNIVLKKSDFENYEDNFPLMSTFIKGLFTTNTILFIGYSLNDPNVKKIISWIKEILNEDFRKVYLVEFDDGKIRLENDNMINRIVLPNSSENKGQIVADLLRKINKKKKELIEEEDFLVYSNLEYLTGLNFEELLKDIKYTHFEMTNEEEKKYLQ